MGGGGSKSSSSASQATSIISDVITTNVTNHSTVVQQEQYIRIGGDYNVVSGVVMNQGYEINISEATSSDQIANMQTDITAQLQQAAASESTALLDALSSTDASINADIETEIRSLINTENITNIVVQVNQSQGIDVTGSHNIVRNISFHQFGSIIDENVRNLTQSSSLITTMDTVMAQTAAAKSTNPLNVFVDAITATGDAVGEVIGIGALGLWAPLILIVLIIGMGYLFAGDDVTSPMLMPAMRPLPPRPMRPRMVQAPPPTPAPIVTPAPILTPV